MGIKIFVAIALFLAAVNCEKDSYEGYRLVGLTPKTVEQAELIASLDENNDFDLFHNARGVNKNATVLLSPDSFSKYESIFRASNIPFSIIEENYQKLIDEQERSMIRTRFDRTIVGKYARHSQINTFISQIVSEYPNLASSYSAGRTYEGRDLRVLVLRTSSSRRKVWMDCGIHAREWASPATCVWTINKLVSEYASGVASTVSLLNYFEFHILPVLNPDGYEFSHTNTRLWRKNKSPSSSSSCVGVDLNRNFGYQWMTGGSSSSPCSEIYAGPRANSELETQALQNAINKYLGQWDAYLTVHSYGLWWFTPFGYSTVLPQDYNDMIAKAKIGVDAIQKTYNTYGWVYGPSSKILYVSSGGSEDWTYAVAKIKYSYCLELRPGQYDPDYRYGFTLPEDRAPYVGEETYRGIKAFLESIKA